MTPESGHLGIWARLRRWRRSHRWLLVLVAWGLSSVLALAGLAVALSREDSALGIDDAIFGTLSIFTSPQTLIENPPALLRWARVVAAGALLLAAEGTAVLLFREPLDRWAASRRRGHAIVCGLGACGSRLARSFEERGIRVVVVDKAPEATAAEACRQRQTPVIIGDASDQAILRAAGLARANHLLVFCGEDGINAGVALAAGRSLTGRPGPPLTCTIHIDDPGLCRALADWQTSSAGRGGGPSGGIRFRFFNPGAVVAPPLLASRPGFDESGRSDGRPAHMLLVGLGAVGGGLLIHAARTWRILVESGSGLPVTVLDRQAEGLVADLIRLHPIIGEVCQIHTIDADVTAAGFSVESVLSRFPARETTAITSAYVCLGDDAQALTVALALRRAPALEGAALTVRTSDREGVAMLLNPSRNGADMVAFGVLDRTCHPEVIIDGPNEELARFIHEEYLRNVPESDLPEWDQLPEALKESNRDQADHVGVKLAAVGCSLLPLSDSDRALVVFTDEEVEHLARMEHDRWLKERRSSGWRLDPGPPDPVKLTTPFLVEWGSLPTDVRDRNHQTVRALPRLLARAGYLCVRGDLTDVIARAIHADYVRRGVAAGRSELTDPSLCAWDDLETSLQDSNRDQARHITGKLRAVGCSVAPVTAKSAGVTFTGDEVERMAVMEHDRWVADRLASGWTPGPRDPIAHTTPYLVPWDELDEPTRDLDREAVRAIPDVLAEAGLAVVRR